MKNARDDIFNGSVSPTAIAAYETVAECRDALAIFNRDLPSFCRRLDIPAAWLSLRTPELLMLVCMRQQGIIDQLRADFDELSRVAVTKE